MQLEWLKERYNLEGCISIPSLRFCKKRDKLGVIKDNHPSEVAIARIEE